MCFAAENASIVYTLGQRVRRVKYRTSCGGDGGGLRIASRSRVCTDGRDVEMSEHEVDHVQKKKFICQGTARA